MTNHVRSVFLIRHGRTSYNAAHKLQGQVDIPLDAVGEWQVKQTAAALKSLVRRSSAGNQPPVHCLLRFEARARHRASFRRRIGWNRARR